MPTHHLSPEPLTAQAFAPYGDVIETAGHTPLLINEDLTERYHGLAQADVGEGYTLINIFRTTPKPLPITVKGMERHPLGSQAFIPLGYAPFLVLVANTSGPPKTADLKLFLTNGRQGVNYHRNIWHHYHLALHEVGNFLVVDRGGEGDNLEEMTFSMDQKLVIKLL